MIRAAALALALLMAAPVEAAACHRYSRWLYPWPQPCQGRQEARLGNRPLPATPGRVGALPGPPAAEIALPTLSPSDCEGGEADELTRGRLMLRALLEGGHAE